MKNYMRGYRKTHIQKQHSFDPAENRRRIAFLKQNGIHFRILENPAYEKYEDMMSMVTYEGEAIGENPAMRYILAQPPKYLVEFQLVREPDFCCSCGKDDWDRIVESVPVRISRTVLRLPWTEKDEFIPLGQVSRGRGCGHYRFNKREKAERLAYKFSACRCDFNTLKRYVHFDTVLQEIGVCASCSKEIPSA